MSEREKLVNEKFPFIRGIFHLCELFRSDDRSSHFAASKSVDVFNAADEERKFLVLRKRERALVHDAEVFRERDRTRDAFVSDGVGMLGGVLIVHAVDFGTFDENVAVEFERAEDGCGVGSEVGIS